MVSGVRYRETRGRILNHPLSGIMYIIGQFKDDPETPDFCMKLTSEISAEDFRAGYSMSGMYGEMCSVMLYLSGISGRGRGWKSLTES